jgi:hypothetical protein
MSSGKLLLLITILLSLHTSCSNKVDEQELRQFLNTTSQNRLDFRKSFRAFGDSCKSHHFYSQQILDKVMGDSIYDRYFEKGYLAYHDSLRTRMAVNQQFFKTQWTNTKPVVKYYERLDMDFDQTLELMKSENLSERAGLDSLKQIASKMNSMIGKIDSMQNRSRTVYWEFRKDYDEYEYNFKNLKALYSNKINSTKK